MAPTKPKPKLNFTGPKPTQPALSPVSTAIKKNPKTTPPPRALVDLDTDCGVPFKGSPCRKPLASCKIHTKTQKRAIIGRSLSYDMLVIPEWRAPSPSPDIEIVEGNTEGGGKEKVKRKKVEKPSKPEKRVVGRPRTSLEREVAEDLRLHMQRKPWSSDELKTARKIIEKIREHEGPGGQI